MAKRQKTKAFSLQGFDNRHYKTTEQYVAAVDALYGRATLEIAYAASKGTYNPDKPFSFDDYPKTKAKAESIINDLANKVTAIVQTGSRKQWLFACKKNDEFVASILDTSKVGKADLKKMQDRNLDAMQTFQGRKLDGMNLSQRVWKYTEQYKAQIELGLDVGLGEGRSAQQLSKDLRQNLQDPDRLFRRVRDKRGNLQLSKAAKAFHPGIGVYRSSAKNAARLTRSEINMAYRESDWLRWQQLDFVIGFEVQRSNHEPQCKCTVCERLVGRYPKYFKFKGWHPQCMCFATPIMEDFFSKSRSDDRVNRLKAALKGTEYKKYVSPETVTDVPDGFKDWVAEKADEQSKWKSTPYFIKDNFKGGLLGDGLIVVAKQKHIKTETEIADIQSRWNTRVAANKYNELLLQYINENGAIGVYANTIKSQIAKGLSISQIDNMIDNLNHKIEVKAQWNERVENNKLAILLDNVVVNKAKFGLEAMQTTYKAVETKLATWESLPLEQQAKKLNFEIDWVEKNKKYDTWTVAQGAYKKHLALVEYQMAKQTIETNTTHAFEFLKSTKSAKIKVLANEMEKLLGNNAPIDQLNVKADALNKEVAKLEMAKMVRDSKANGISPDAYTQARKNAALWAKQSKKADSELRDTCGKVWQKATADEKTAAYRYTAGSSYINEPLREQQYVGKYLGKYDSKKDIDALTTLINKSYYTKDVWVQRGVGMSGANGLLGENLNNANASKLVGKLCTEKAFSSCAAVKGKGFSSSEIIYNIYCPKGTKMLYCEPFSAFGAGDGQKWNGVSPQSRFNSEVEFLLQRGTTFRVTKIEQSGGKWYIDLEVISQL